MEIINQIKIKNMNKSIYLLVCLLAFQFSLKAQSDPKATKVVNQVLEKVRSYNNIKVNFKYTLANKKENISQSTRGELHLKNELYRLKLMGATRIFDGKKLYTIVPADEEVTISNYNENKEDGVSPSQMLTFFEEGYLYKWVDEKNHDGRVFQEIKLIPKNANTEVKNVILYVDKQTSNIYKLVQNLKNNTQTIVEVNEFKTDQQLPKKLFLFNKKKYANYYINNIR